MANAQGFGTPRFVKPRVGKTQQHSHWQGMPDVDLETRTQLWQTGLLRLQLPQGVKARSLTAVEVEWLDQAAKAEYITSESQQAIFYTSPLPDFRLEAADWYLRPNDYWNYDPVLLQAIIEQFPADLFQLSASGQPPAFYPERTSDYTDEQEMVMRSIFRETTRLGWSLPQYKWFVMKQLRKTTAQVTYDEAVRLLTQLQSMEGEIDD
jgi:hypothetical protein